MNKIAEIMSTPSLVLMGVCLIVAAVLVGFIIAQVRKDERFDEDENIGPCCQYCAYWFSEHRCDRGVCEKKSTKANACYTAPTYFCSDYDGFIPWKEDQEHG